MGAFDPDAGCTLTDDLKAFWKLGEVSGTRVDSFGSNDLTDNNTVTQATGIVGNAAQFTAANTEFLDIADNADLSTGNISFSICGWAFFDTFPVGGSGITAKGDANANSTFEYSLESETVSGPLTQFRFIISDGTSTSTVQSLSFGGLSLDTWYFVVAGYDADADELFISVNNGTVDTTTFTTGSQDTTEPFVIGSRKVVAGHDIFMDGRIDEVGFWKRVLTAQEKTDLYNGGSGNTFDPSGTCTLSKPHFFIVFD